MNHWKADALGLWQQVEGIPVCGAEMETIKNERTG
jgi:hypothetical protein